MIWVKKNIDLFLRIFKFHLIKNLGHAAEVNLRISTIQVIHVIEKRAFQKLFKYNFRSKNESVALKKCHYEKDK